MHIETKSYHNNKKVPVVVVEGDDGWWYVCEFQFSEPEAGVNTQKVFQLSSFCSVSVTTQATTSSPSQSIKKQRASTETCLLANAYRNKELPQKKSACGSC